LVRERTIATDVRLIIEPCCMRGFSRSAHRTSV
jgi:hypothetical protein